LVSLRRLWADVRAATAAEYAIILAVIGGALVLSALALGQSIVCSIDDSSAVLAGDPQTGHQYGNSAPPGKAKGHHPGC
jgi:Flp pilus assembly pilin Flp